METTESTSKPLKVACRIAKPFILGILKIEKALFFRTGARLLLLRRYFAWQSRFNQEALDRLNAERSQGKPETAEA